MFKRIVIIISIVALCWHCVPVSVPDSSTISANELRKHVTYLAADELEGRKPGSEGGRQAADYIRQQFRSNNLELLAEDGFQQFQVVTAVKAGENNRLTFKDFTGSLGDDFTALAFTENTSLSAPVIYVGYGFEFETDSITHHDYNGIDVSDHWVLVFRGDPDLDNLDSPYLPYGSLRSKVLTARDQKAAGVLFVSGVDFDEQDDLIDLYYDGGQKTVGIPVIQIKRQVADLLLSDASTSVAELEQQLNQAEPPEPFLIDMPVNAVTEVIKTEAETQNIVAILPGSDPLLKDEYVIVGAHYDHLGMGGPGSGSRRPDTLAIHNGADDNASGTAALLELAEQSSARRQNLKRSILFISFGAEEMGLLGSKHFTANPLIDLNQVTAMFNLDMLGNYYPDSTVLSIGGTGTAVGLTDLVTKYASAAEIAVNLAPEGYGPSDHASFYTKDIPVLFFFTGAHDRYHTPADDIQFLSYGGEEQVVKLISGLIKDMVNSSEELVFQEAGPKTRTSYRRRFKVTLGFMPDHAAQGITGLRVDVTFPGRPAALAGMKKGDIIVAMEGKPVGDIYEYMHRLSDFKVGQRISVEVLRGEDKIILIVEL